MSTKPTCFILGGGLNGLDVLRMLGPRGIRCIVFSTQAQDFAFRSRYAAAAVVVPADDPTAAAHRIHSLARAESSPPVVIPGSDGFLSLLDAHRDTLAGSIRVNLPTREAVAAVLSKEQFGALGAAKDLPIVRTGQLSAADLLRPQLLGERLATLNLQFPLIAKPEFSGDWAALPEVSGLHEAKALNLENLSSIQRIAERWPQALTGAVLQEYLVGADDQHYSFMAYIDRAGQERISFGVRKLRINPVHNGVATFCEISADPDLAAAGRAILNGLDYRGCVSVCFKRCQQRQRYLCYEVNGRMPLAHGVGMSAGKSLALSCYEELADCSQPFAIEPSKGCWLRLSGDVAAFRGYRREKSIRTLDWVQSLVRSGGPQEWSWRDPRPFLELLKEPLRRRFLPDLNSG